MIPFMKKDFKQTGVIVQTRKPDGGATSETEEKEDPALEAIGEDLMRAFASKDSKALVMALKAAFEIFDSMPHKEGEHTDFDSQNELAAKAK